MPHVYINTSQYHRDLLSYATSWLISLSNGQFSLLGQEKINEVQIFALFIAHVYIEMVKSFYSQDLIEK